MTTILRAADVLIVAAWSAICFYFLRRWWLHRRLVSVSLAVMALGWIFVGTAGTLSPGPNIMLCLKVLSLVASAFAWYSIIRVERTGR